MLRRLLLLHLLIGLLSLLSACAAAPFEPVTADARTSAAASATAAQPTGIPAAETPMPTEVVAVQPTAVPTQTLVPSVQPSPTPAPATVVPTNARVDGSIRQTDWASVLANDPKLTSTDWFGETRYEVKGIEAHVGGIPIIEHIVYLDLDGDAIEEASIPLASGGTAGNIGFFVYRQAVPSPTLAAWRGGYKQWLQEQQGQLVASDALYMGFEGNCCPSGRLFTTYALAGNELQVVAERSEGHSGVEPLIVQYFYGLLNNREFDKAYALLGDPYRSANPYEGWAAGYATTVKIEPTVTAGATPGVVQVDLTAIDTTASGEQRVQHFTGTWEVRWSQARKQWELDSPKFAPAP